jgi:hypothetical protein
MNIEKSPYSQLRWQGRVQKNVHLGQRSTLKYREEEIYGRGKLAQNKQ